MAYVKRQAALRHLMADPVMAGIIKQIELKAFRPRANRFQSLVNSIIGQQLSTKAADTIIQRFENLFPKGKFPSAAGVLKISPARPRSAGLSGAKVRYIRELARAVRSGRLNFDKLLKKPDEEIIAELTAVKGIGRWTAEMFLIFSVGHPDIYSHGDLGLKNAVWKFYRIHHKRHPRKYKALVESWKPHRSLASRYLWKGLELGR